MKRSTPTLASLLAAMIISVTGSVGAQTVRPNQEREPLPQLDEESAESPLLIPEVPDFEPEQRTPGTVLPPLDDDEPGGVDPELAPGRRVRIDSIDIRGNSVLPEAVLREAAARWIGREVGHAELDELQDELTRAYVDRGYVTSGVVIPRQSITDGALAVEVVEGVLAAVDIQTDGHFRPSHLGRKIGRNRGKVVDVIGLENTLALLQQDPLIQSVEASLVPGEHRGESILRVRVHERDSWSASVSGDNYSSPAIGEGGGTVRLDYYNLNGRGDTLRLEYQGTKGLNDVQTSYQTPFTPWDTRIELHMRRTWSEVVENPFDDLEIESETETYGWTVTQPVLMSRSTQTDLFVTGEWRRSRSFLLGQSISFVPGPDDGVATIAVIRAGGSWQSRSPDRVLAARSMISSGLDALDSTDNGGAIPDSRFTAWLTQLQAAQRLPWLDAQLIGVASLQLSSQPLLGLEQFAIGGRYSVRGYRENQLVRDQGVAGGVELRVPVRLPSGIDWRPRLQLAAFFDAGRSWQKNRETTGDRILLGAGVGALLALSELIQLEFYWGHAIEGTEQFGKGDSLQNDGVHLGISLQVP